METEHLLVVLQSCSKFNALEKCKEELRYPGVPKVDVSKRCIWSLIHSLNYAKIRKPNLEIEFRILDDNSDLEFKKDLKKILSLATFPVMCRELDGVGIMKSILYSYETGKEFGKEYLYFVQDDFLHHETAIYYMLENYKLFSSKLEKEITLTGNHSPRYNYPDNIKVGCKVVQGIDQHWRTTHASQFTAMMHKKLLLDNWDLFEKFGNVEYDNGCCEDKSINHLYFYRNYVEFCPIQSLTLEIQWDLHKDPYINWRSWWDRYDLTVLNS